MIVAQRAEQDQQDERDQHAAGWPTQASGSAATFRAPPRSQALSRAAPLLRPDRDGDDRALDDQRRGVGHAVGEQGVAHELDQQRADQRADDASPVRR